ncbi:MAG TPA: AAA family ATPase [Acidimicrobiales bacterium]|nr:MAG: hypothetical protein B7Z69_00855 [Actinobacteria bacterium 21-73-9]HQU27328.1 AAA family ATPase [Acidimicrobiales bacterium]
MPRARLLEIHARDLGVIEEATLELSPGFTVVTGETGAGKTLLVGALALSLGLETDGARYALGPATRAVALVEVDGREVALAREMSASGRLRATVDGAPASAEALRTLAAGLVEIHGQHDSLRLRSSEAVVELVDRAGAIDASDLARAREELVGLRRERDALGGDPTERARRLEYVEFQLAEFDAVAPAGPGELDEVLAELTRLSDLRDGQGALAEALALFDGDADETVLGSFARALARVPEGVAYRPVREALDEALVAAREAVRDLAALHDPEAVDEARLGALEERARVLNVLTRKHAGTLADALALRAALERERAELASAGARLVKLDEGIAAAEGTVAELAAQVRARRDAAAQALSVSVGAQMSRVALAGARIRFVVEGEDGSRGSILFSANEGRSLGPLDALASGGELSRVLLAISLEATDGSSVAVFDEIDAGLGGLVAQQIGECLAELARRQQVLAVTHLASVAARADRHFVIDKRVVGGRATTTVREVAGEERVGEIARMLAGEAEGDESRALARRLLGTGVRRAAPPPG